VFSYSTCTDCGDLLHVTEHAQTVHPGCKRPKPTRLDLLYGDWNAAIAQGDTVIENELEAQIAELESQPPRLLDAALIYAEWGWPVFPLKPCLKVPATRNGFKDATTDTAQIRDWWLRHPDSNIGLPTGGMFDVVDIDPRHGGHDSLRRIVAAEDDKGVGPIPDTHGRVATAGGGLHYYIEPTGDPNGANLLPGIDIRGKGGYVVGPPSWLGEHTSRWSWTVKPSPRIRRVA
jgi:hypothetical protein